MLKPEPKDFLLGSVLLAGAAGLGVEFLLQTKFSTSLCGTQACDVAGSHLQAGQLGEAGLLFLGFLFFVVLYGLFFLSQKVFRTERDVLGRFSRTGFWTLLIGALAFDGALMGYQIITPGPVCVLCAAVAAGLLVVLVVAAWHCGFKAAFVLGLAVWVGSFAGSAILDHGHEKAQSVSDSPGIQEAAAVQEVFDESGARYCLFFSFNCSHCSEVLFNLAQSDLSGRWHIACLDRDPEALARLAEVASQEGQYGNVFMRLMRAKAIKIKQNGAESGYPPENLKTASENALACFRNWNLPGVPTLVVEKQNGVRVSLPGTRNIASFLQEEGFLNQWRSM